MVKTEQGTTCKKNYKASKGWARAQFSPPPPPHGAACLSQAAQHLKVRLSSCAMFPRAHYLLSLQGPFLPLVFSPCNVRQLKNHAPRMRRLCRCCCFCCFCLHSVHPPHLPPHPQAAANTLTTHTSAAELDLSALEVAEVSVNAAIGAHTQQPRLCNHNHLRLCRHPIAQLYRRGTTVSPAMLFR